MLTEFQSFSRTLQGYSVNNRPSIESLVKTSRWTTLERKNLFFFKKQVVAVYCIGIIDVRHGDTEWFYVGSTQNLQQRILNHTNGYLKQIEENIKDNTNQKIVFLYYPFLSITKEYLMKSEYFCIGIFNPCLNFGKHKAQRYSKDSVLHESFPLRTYSVVSFFDE